MAALLTAAQNGCAPAAPSAPPARARATPSPPAAEPTAPEPPAEIRCGKIACQLFDRPEQALAAVLQSRPLVVAVGETHAQAGTEHVQSTTSRFTEKLLPLFASRTSDLVLELWVASGECGERETEVAERQQPVTETQAQSNQNEFLTLGRQASALGIRPHILRPSCEQYEAIVDAGEDAIVKMLEMIADLTAVMVKAIVERNQRQGIEKVVLAYGGIVHNDVRPREGRERWSFGPRLRSLAQGRYVELDLIVPEYIKDGPPWSSLGWVADFDQAQHAGKVRLLSPGPDSYVLVFASSSAD
jgi:hypothetical protein